MITRSFRRSAIVLSIGTYVVLLAGQLTPARLGIDLDLPIPPNVMAAGSLLVVLGIPTLYFVRETPDRQTVRVPGLRLVLALLVVLLLSSLWAEGNSTDGEIWSILAMASLLACVTISLKANLPITIHTLMVCTAVAGVVYSSAGLLSLGNLARVSVFGGGPNVFGRVTGLGMVAILYLMSTQRNSPWLALLLIPTGVATVLSGSRGAMLGTVLALAFVVIMLGRRVWSKVLAGVCVALIPGLFLYQRYGESIEKVVTLRIVKLTIEDGYLAGRDNLWSDALAYLSQHPLAGSGIGTFIAQVGTYPHDLPLQIGVDSGVIGMTLFVATMAYFAGAALRLRPSNSAAIGAAACAFLILVASLFSGGYYDSRFMWVWLIVMSASVAARRRRVIARSPGQHGAQESIASRQNADSLAGCDAAGRPDRDIAEWKTS